MYAWNVSALDKETMMRKLTFEIKRQLIQAAAFGADGKMRLKRLFFFRREQSVHAQVHICNVVFTGLQDRIPPFPFLDDEPSKKFPSRLRRIFSRAREMRDFTVPGCNCRASPIS
mgnify:CR=1 FL=1